MVFWFAEKELNSSTEGLDLELRSRQSMLQQQQSHIVMVEGSLSDAQSSVGRLEEEVGSLGWSLTEFPTLHILLNIHTQAHIMNILED